MDTKYLIVYKSRHWKAVETLDELFPKFQRIPPFTFIIESIYSVDGTTFMITSEKKKIFRKLDFIGHHQTNDFEILLTSIYIVTKE